MEQVTTLDPQLERRYRAASRGRLIGLIRKMMHEVHVSAHIHGSDLVCVEASELEEVLEWALTKVIPSK